ncbi:DUF742 domain-containing protein [Streptomyces tateyamensis]|uniref:DUF742 domain-containing protein n=1 Tax=Streptomyces tateyamensis TaxID=565073 RepID=A0A2V4MZG5_9ACTN|nr:DUF742 domain-containing protein [Streptomyces tateyamensis]
MSGRAPEDDPVESADAPSEATGPAVPGQPADRWYDDEAGPMVRLFSLTRGRTRPAGDGYFDLISMVSARSAADRDPLLPEPVLDPEHQAILDLCADEPLSVAELGSYTDLPVSVVRVLLGDLDDAELIDVTRPVPLAELPDEHLLREVINGLRAL